MNRSGIYFDEKECHAMATVLTPPRDALLAVFFVDYAFDPKMEDATNSSIKRLNGTVRVSLAGAEGTIALWEQQNDIHSI
jgi:hypothetical protein